MKKHPQKRSEQAMIDRAIQEYNPWWEDGKPVARFKTNHRHMFNAFAYECLQTMEPKSVVLLGPRRVGKTVMLAQLVDKIIEERLLPPANICYVSMDYASLQNIDLITLFQMVFDRPEVDNASRRIFIIDEIQQCRGWATRLKLLTNLFPKDRFIVAGSATASIKTKTEDTGMGRFTLQPLTFAEFLDFRKTEPEMLLPTSAEELVGSGTKDIDITELNKRFTDYLEFGSFPGAVNKANEGMAVEGIKEDLLADLRRTNLSIDDMPSRITELLFSYLAKHNGAQISLAKLTAALDISKNALINNLSFLEDSFLIRILPSVGRELTRLQRTRNFKVYLLNSSMPTLLGNYSNLGQIVEGAVIAQYRFDPIRRNDLCFYKENSRYEVDLIEQQMGAADPIRMLEIKWSNKMEPRSLARLAKLHQLLETDSVLYLTKTLFKPRQQVNGVQISYLPCALYCYLTGFQDPQQQQATLLD